MLRAVEDYFLNYEEANTLWSTLIQIKFFCKKLSTNLEKPLKRVEELLELLEPFKDDPEKKIRMTKTENKLKEGKTLNINTAKEIEKSLKGVDSKSISSELLGGKSKPTQTKITKDELDIFDKDTFDNKLLDEKVNDVLKEEKSKTKESYKDFKKKLDTEIKTIKQKQKVEVVDDNKMKRI